MMPLDTQINLPTSSPRDLLHVPMRSLRDLLHVFVLQCLVRSGMDNGAESHRVCSATPTESKYGQGNRSHARAWDTSLFHSRISLVSLIITRSVSALED